MGVNMSSGEFFIILLMISGSIAEHGERNELNNFRRDNPSCDVLIKDVKGEITSPGYPNGYPPYSDCRYTILQSNEAICQLSIHFVDFDLEESPNCFKDKVLIGEKPFCGRLRNHRTNWNLNGKLTIRFVSDSDGNGRGFRLGLEQIHCGNSLRHREELDGYCCDREYGEPHFLLTSPGFLGTEWKESNCRYVIFPSSENVCRLRFRFKHFWVGEEDVFYGCLNGFVEIDRRRFCGCMDGYEYVSSFDEGRRKEIWYSHGGPGNRGFVIEVFQEECRPFGNRTEFDPNTEIEVFMTNVTSEKAVSRFLIPRDGSRCRDWGQPEWIRTVSSLVRSAPCRPVTASQFYPFPEAPNPFPEDPEPFPAPVEPAYPPPITPPILYPINSFVFFDYTGHFVTPNYPSRYLPNFEWYYIIEARPGHCGVQLRFVDFNLEKSFKCWKDYLLINSRRYCGNYLLGRKDVYRFDAKGQFSMKFVTDWCFSGRGFYVTYRQIPCVIPFGKLESLPKSGNSSVDVLN